MIARTSLAVGIFALKPTPFGALLGLLSYLALPRVVRLFESAQAVEKRMGIEREIPLLAELLSAHLTAGAGLLDALDSVSISLHSELAGLTMEVTQRLRDGTPDCFAPWRRVPALIGLADSCAQALRTGASISSAASRVAIRMRSREFRQRQSSLERAVVRMVLPMGVCLLPAFIATVVIPMAYALFQAVDF